MKYRQIIPLVSLVCAAINAFGETANPARFAELTAQRTLLFWFPPFGKGSDNYLLWAVTLLGFGGLALSWKTNPIAASLLGPTLLLYPLVYYAIQHFTRYRYPILWVSSLMAAYALEYAWLKITGPATRAAPKNPLPYASYSEMSSCFKDLSRRSLQEPQSNLLKSTRMKAYDTTAGSLPQAGLGGEIPPVETELLTFF